MLEFLQKILSLAVEDVAMFYLMIAFGVGVVAVLVWSAFTGRMTMLLLVYIFSGLVAASSWEQFVGAAKILQWCILLGMFLTVLFQRPVLSSGHVPDHRMSLNKILFLVFWFLGMLSIAQSGAVMYGAMRQFYMLLVFVVFYVGIYGRIDSPDAARSVLSSFIWLGILYGIAMIPVIILRPSWAYRGLRFTGFFFGAPGAAMSTMLFAVLTVWFLVNDERKSLKPIAAIALVSMLITMLMSSQRAGGYMFLVAAGIIIILSGRRMVLWGGIILLVIVLIWTNLALLPNAEFIERRAFSLDTTGRYHLWKWTWDHGMQHPYLGNGVGSTESKLLLEEGYGTHSAYLSAFGDTGFPGMVLFALIIIVPGLKAFTVVLRREISRKTRSLAVYVTACSAALFLGSFVEGSFYGTANLMATLVFLTAVLSDRIAEFAREECSHKILPHGYLAGVV